MVGNGMSPGAASPENPVRIAVLVSGNGSNLQALLDKRHLFPNASLALVISSRPDAFALTRARQAGVETLVLEPKAYPTREEYTDAVVDSMLARSIGLVVFAGFGYILSPRFCEMFRGRAINVHPALLPAFGGVGMVGLRVHRAVLEAGVAETGATVHFVTEGVDTGEILLQKSVPVLPDDTPESLQRRVLEVCEWDILPRVVASLTT